MDLLLARRSRPFRIAVSMLAAVVLVGGASPVGADTPTPSSAGPRILDAAAGTAADARSARIDWNALEPGVVQDSPAVLGPDAGAAVAPPPRPQPAAEPVTERVTDHVAAKQPAAPHAVTYAGTNHLWIPALGINRAIYTYACSRSTPLDNLVYRWGCAGQNNLYLMGHAWGVFKPLADAYQQGRLRVGMEAIYADGTSHIHRYRVVAWRVVLPTDTTWIGAMTVPTMILQTCYGATSTYRLNVRLVAES